MNPWKEKRVIGNAELYLGDCLEILPHLPKVDAVITDPPYGIGESRNHNASRSALAISKDYGSSPWDDKPIAPEDMKLIIASGLHSVIFGGNFYPMEPSPCWLVWDKCNGENDFADCELAWTNLRKAVRRIQYRWHGMLRDGGEGRGDHPTQKPVGVMKWAINQLPTSCLVIIDPFMGSGTTGVACMNLGRKFIGIEIEPKYFEIACERIENAQRQMRMFA